MWSLASHAATNSTTKLLDTDESCYMACKLRARKQLAYSSNDI